MFLSLFLMRCLFGERTGTVAVAKLSCVQRDSNSRGDVVRCSL
jgi:hypothetical protein